MEPTQIKENLMELASQLVRLKPSTAKGTYVKSVALSTTMGPGVRIDPNEIVRIAGDMR